MGFFMRKIQMLLNPFISQPDVFAGVYLPARRSGCETRLHRGNHAKPTSVELNLHRLTVLSPFKHPSRALLCCFQIPIAAACVLLRGLVQHVLSPRCPCQNILELDCLQALGIKRYTLGGDTADGRQVGPVPVVERLDNITAPLGFYEEVLVCQGVS